MGEILLGNVSAAGYESMLEVESPDSVIIKITKCPRYDAFKMSGLSDDVVGSYCTMGGKNAIDRQLKLLDPKIGFRLARAHITYLTSS